MRKLLCRWQILRLHKGLQCKVIAQHIALDHAPHAAYVIRTAIGQAAHHGETKLVAAQRGQIDLGRQPTHR